MVEIGMEDIGFFLFIISFWLDQLAFPQIQALRNVFFGCFVQTRPGVDADKTNQSQPNNTSQQNECNKTFRFGVPICFFILIFVFEIQASRFQFAKRFDMFIHILKQLKHKLVWIVGESAGSSRLILDRMATFLHWIELDRIRVTSHWSLVCEHHLNSNDKMQCTACSPPVRIGRSNIQSDIWCKHILVATNAVRC